MANLTHSLNLVVEDVKHALFHVDLTSVERQTGISRSTLCRIRRGYLPNVENLQKLCVFIDLKSAEQSAPAA